MVIMDAYYAPDRLQDVWENIDHVHLTYLEMEEGSEKLEHRNRLEDCIRQFLCMASHSRKFLFRETADILHRSASNKKDFSGYKAATGWNAIQLYAGNLLSQPWRKEYRYVKTYCGFYKHQIEANLVGAELMFEAMGYRHTGNGILVLDDPICPDTVTNVSKDCLIAYVECQILKAIWEELSSTCKISWLEVLEFRKNHLCTPEQSIRALKYQLQQKQYDAQNSDIYNNRTHQTTNFPPLIAHNPLSYPTLPYVYNSSSCCPNNYATYAHPSYAMAMQCPIKPQFTNGYYMANGYATQPHAVYGTSVPIAQLIDVESQRMDVERPITNSKSSKNALYEVKKNNETKPPKEPERDNEYSEDWDYVYRNLKSQGYSKDLGERGDILSPASNTKKTKSTNLDEVMNNLMVTDRPLRVSEALAKFDSVPQKQTAEKRQSVNSSYENLSENKKAAPSKAANKAKSVKNVERNGNNNSQQPKNSSTKWECKSCTFLNDHSKDICEMCSKSRYTVEQQMEIGGPQCSKCTLVNPKDMKECQACASSLKDSPTYI